MRRRRIILTVALFLGVAPLAARANDPSSGPPTIDLYGGYAYELIWDSRPVAGFSKLSPVLVPTGRTHPPVVLENGTTADTAFAAWAEKTATAGTGAGRLHDVRLEDKSGAATKTYSYKKCWASKYAASLPALSGKGSGVGVQELWLQCGG
jgi:phage tail-like protein